MCFAMAEVVGGVFTAAICHVVVHRWMMAEVLYPAILRAEAASAMASAGQKHELEDSSDQPRKGLRKERRLAQDPLQCPVCGVTVRLETLASHYQQEFQRLKSPPRKHHHSRRDSHTLLAVNSNSTAALAPPSSRPQGPTGPVEGDHGGTSVMQRARAALDATRRRSFLFRQGVSPNPPDPTTCQQAVSHSEHGLGAGQAESHTVEAASSSSDSEEYEEYTWCDVTRVRATSLLDAGTRANIFNGTLITPADEASSCDLDIETDSSRLYGPTQFTEEDISRCSILVPDDKESPSTVSHDPGHHQAPPQCLICMDVYSSPVVSVLCWHVFCQQCWLKALSTQKLCPTCKTITCPGDLRRIFL